MHKLTPSMQQAHDAIIKQGGTNAEQLPAFKQLVNQAQAVTDTVLQVFNKPNRNLYLVKAHIDNLDDMFMAVISQTVERCYASTMRLMEVKVREVSELKARIAELEGTKETVN